MARYRHYDPQQTKMIAVSYGRQLLPGTFEHALSYLIDNEIDLGRFAARFKNDETGAPANDPAVFAQGGVVCLLAGHHLVTHDGAGGRRERDVHRAGVRPAAALHHPGALRGDVGPCSRSGVS